MTGSISENEDKYLDDCIFVGREEELEKLNSYLKKLEEGEGQTIFIAGEPGVGKSRLADELKDRAVEKDFTVMSEVCRSEFRRPYFPLRKAWFESKGNPLPSLIRIKNQERVVVENKDMLEANRNAAFYETFKELEKDADKSPHLIILEDLHLADEGTLNLFNYLADRLSQSPVLFLATYQPGEAVPGSAFIDMKNRLSRKNIFKEIDLDPLSIQKVEALTKKLLSKDDIPEDFLEILYEKTDGNPLFIREGIRHMAEAGVIDITENRYPRSEEEFILPDMFRDVVIRRTYKLSREVRKILQLGSVIGKKIPFSLLVEASDTGEMVVLDHVDALIDHNLWLESEDGSFRFSHEIMRDIIYEGLGRWVEKQRLHQKVADALKKVYDDELEDKYNSMADHLYQAEDYQQAVEYYIKSAKKAENIYAYNDAIEMYEKALNICEKEIEDNEIKLEIVKDMAEAYRLIGRYEKSREVLKKSLLWTSDFEEEQRINLLIVTGLLEQGKIEEGLDIIEKRLSLESEDSVLKGEYLSKKGWGFLRSGRFKKARKVFEKERELAEKIQDDSLIAQSHHDIGGAALKQQKFGEAKKHLKKARDIKEELGDPSDLTKTLNSLAGVYYFEGFYDKALDGFRDCLDLYKEIGDKSKMTIVNNNIGMTYQKQGDLNKALEYLHKSLKLADQTNNEFEKSRVLVNQGITYLVKNEVERAEELLEKGRQLAESSGNLDKKVEAEYLLGILKIKDKDVSPAEEYLEKLRESISERDADKDKGLIELLKGLIRQSKGELEEARSLLEEALEIFDSIDALDKKAITLYELGKIRDGLGEEEEGKEDIRNALTHFEKKGMKFWIVRCEEALEEK